ncbi:hypothetical protein F5B20DRAFT_498669 [Whalleya microplaca]|nr:hypothetical protein F5B20DRAFT_498669 [Whalleya microplaca]
MGNCPVQTTVEDGSIYILRISPFLYIVVFAIHGGIEVYLIWSWMARWRDTQCTLLPLAFLLFCQIGVIMHIRAKPTYGWMYGLAGLPRWRWYICDIAQIE